MTVRELLIHPSHEQYLQHQTGTVIGSLEFDLPAAVRLVLSGELPKKKPSRRDHFFYTFGIRRRLRLALTRAETSTLRRFDLPDRSRTPLERLIEAHAQGLGYMIGLHTCGSFCGPECPQKRYARPVSRGKKPHGAKLLTRSRARARLAPKSRS